MKPGRSMKRGDRNNGSKKGGRNNRSKRGDRNNGSKKGSRECFEILLDGVSDFDDIEVIVPGALTETGDLDLVIIICSKCGSENIVQEETNCVETVIFNMNGEQHKWAFCEACLPPKLPLNMQCMCGNDFTAFEAHPITVALGGNYTSSIVCSTECERKISKQFISNGKDMIGFPLYRACNYCDTTDGDMERCSRCKRTTYCSKKCQVAHWKIHKKGCRTAK